MLPEQRPITGKENKENLPELLRALIDFYDAFNRRDLEKMLENWAQTAYRPHQLFFHPNSIKNFQSGDSPADCTRHSRFWWRS